MNGYRKTIRNYAIVLKKNGMKILKIFHKKSERTTIDLGMNNEKYITENGMTINKIVHLFYCTAYDH